MELILLSKKDALEHPVGFGRNIPDPLPDPE